MTIRQALVELFNYEEILNYKPKHHRFWRFVNHIIIAQTLAVIYIDVGHDKGWKRADVWYNCLHTHNPFLWQ